MIDDQDLRALVREAIARRVVNGARDAAAPQDPPVFDRHASHGRLPVAGGSEGDGACLIEPTVGCNHCGYCQSFGH